LPLEAGGIADLGHIAANGVHFKAIQINAPEDYARSCRRRKDF
jgi:hypothetical protein